MKSLVVLGICVGAFAQQIYLPVSGPSTRAYCSAPVLSSDVSSGTSTIRRTGSFAYTQTETVRTATAAPTQQFPTYGSQYDAVKHLFNVSTTTWSNWSPNATATPTDSGDHYGQSAFSALWSSANPGNFSRGIYSTTVSPTPIPTSELILPPPLYFGPRDCYNFPRDFMLGVAGAAAQVEGAIADEGKGPAYPDIQGNLLALAGDQATAILGPDLSNNYIGTENYYLYKQDIDRLAAIGVKYYSFTIAWSRILPFATPGSPVNAQGLQHYDDLIDYAISKGVQPVVTLLHLDAPLTFLGPNYLSAIFERSYYGQVNAGLQNNTFADAFVNYGKIVMAHFADRVPLWVTINEPQPSCNSGPSIDNVIKSHARLYHFYKEQLGGKGRVTMKMSWTPAIPQDPTNSSHVAAAQHYDDLIAGPFLNTLVLGEDYPEALKMTIQDYVPLTKEDLAYLKGTMDIVSFDAYSAVTVFPVGDLAACAANNATTNPYYPHCVGETEATVNGWLMGSHPDYLMYATPTYLRTQLNYIWDTYQTPVAITEFGLPTNSNGNLDLPSIEYDVLRSEYYLSYLTEVLKAIWEDGVDVVGAFAWSWVDNWEWGTYSHQFGLQYNNRTTQERSYKRSFFDLVDFVESRRL